MAWWRRDPSLWARPPTQKYAQRIVRDHEAVLRTRCFSRTPLDAVQRQEHHSAERSEDMTGQEWTRLQRHKKWRRMLQDHPYKGMYGATEEMLRGKGLAEWDWVYKTFPKWMLQEMGPQEPVDQGSDVKGKKGGQHLNLNYP